MAMEKKYLADYIDYKRDIEPHRFINLFAGAGSGKNTFIEKLAKGEISNAPRMRILLITSRRAKVDETFMTYKTTDEESMGLFRQSIGEAKEVYDPYTNTNMLATWPESVICTSAFFAAYMKNCYRPDDIRTHVWQAFDMIVVDEVHAMIVDATYQDAPFHVWDFINHYITLCEDDNFKMRCKHLILMTATPATIVNYNCSIRYDLNVLDICHNIQPETVHFIEKSQVENLLKQIITEGKKCLYFANHVGRIEGDIIRKMKLPKDKLVRSYSKQSERDRLQEDDPEAYADMLEVEEALKSFEIPERFNIFLTTTRYREGINIESDVDVMITESHNPTEVVQMAGRVRKGVKDLYIVTDSEEHFLNIEQERLERLIEKSLLDRNKTANGISMINDLLNEVDAEKLPAFVELVEQKFPYIRFSYFYNCFYDYDPKVSAVRDLINQQYRWEKAKSAKRLPELVQKWFPDAEIEAYEPEQERKYKESWHVWHEMGIELDTLYDKNTYDALKSKLSEIWGDKQMAKLLKRFSTFEVTRYGKAKNQYVFRVTAER